MQRREFIEIGAAACLGSVSATAAWSGPLSGRIRKAVKFHMVAEDLNVVDKLRLLRDVGFDGVEIRTADKVDRRAVAGAIEATGFPVHGVINSSNRDITEAIDLAQLFGGTSVLIVAAEDPKRSYEENFRHWQQVIRSAGRQSWARVARCTACQRGSMGQRDRVASPVGVRKVSQSPFA